MKTLVICDWCFLEFGKENKDINRCKKEERKCFVAYLVLPEVEIVKNLLDYRKLEPENGQETYIYI